MPYTQKSHFSTSKGNIAPDLHWTGHDDAYAERNKMKRHIEQNYGSARVVRAATRTYNCHGYAHAARHAWFNYIDQFLKDDYFPFTPGTLQLNDIVVYEKGGEKAHSGIITQLSGNSIQRLRSKWGAWSEVTHQPSEVPDAYGSIRWYLRRRDALLLSDQEYFEVTAPNAIDDLIEVLSDESIQQKLALASSPDVALAICHTLPEIAGLTLYGELTQEKLMEKLQVAESFEAALPILVALSKNPPSNAIKPSASKLVELHGSAEGVTIAELAAHEMLFSMDSALRLQKVSHNTLDLVKKLSED